MSQYPNSFEFTDDLLIFLCDEIYSNKFGTFLFNNEREIKNFNGKETTVSIWSEIFLNKQMYINPFYQYLKEPLIIRGEVQYLTIWKKFFYKYIKIGMVNEGNFDINGLNYYRKQEMKNGKEIIELMKIIKKNGLEKKIENLDLYKVYKNCLED